MVSQFTNQQTNYAPGLTCKSHPATNPNHTPKATAPPNRGPPKRVDKPPTTPTATAAKTNRTRHGDKAKNIDTYNLLTNT
ncbi:hypothetical protein AAGG49_21855, partial [Stenotrophomonas maltophilia]|uniref:hypothetical protein n=1 Tax=Stenotrophomonas maltophilia TaxID=40324 RepID=UPI00313B94C2